MPDHDDILFSEKYLKAESKIWGAVYLSKDHTYAEYAVAPQSSDLTIHAGLLLYQCLV